MIELTTSNAGETAALGAAIAALATGGEMVVLSGEMGAGKTALTKGLAAALGVADPVTSPTFTLVHEYSGRLRLFHLDVYRIDQLDEVADLAIPELLDDDALTVSGDRCPGASAELDLTQSTLANATFVADLTVPVNADGTFSAAIPLAKAEPGVAVLKARCIAPAPEGAGTVMIAYEPAEGIRLGRTSGSA